jgi:HlyD family secretion protein
MVKISKWLALVLLLIVGGAVFFVLRPSPVMVDVAQVERRPFAETVEEQGRTRARHPYMVTSPIAGRLLRTELDEGDRVSRGEVVARIAPSPQDQRNRAFAEANLVSAQARHRAAEAGLDEATSALSRATSELERRERLFSNNLTSAEEVESYRQLADAAESRVDTAEASLNSALAEIDSARSLLIGVDSEQTDSVLIVDIPSPSDGTIYKVYEENERVIQAGTVLYEISNQDQLEVVVDLLTQEAVRVEPGDSMRVTGWGGDRTIDAIVEYIEPEAFTKISALGVEEQRVNVISELLTAPPENIGAEYRVDVSIATWQSLEELTIPTSAIFQRSNGWNTFVVEDGEVELRQLLIGYRGREYSQVIDGVNEGDTVVVFPSDLINQGTRVTF